MLEMTLRLYIADLRSNANNGVSTGHFFPVAAMYQQLFKDVCDVVVAGGPVYKTRFKDEELCLLPYNVSGTSLKDKWHTMKNAIKLFKEAKGQTIVIQQGTVVTAFIAIALFFHRASKLYMIQYSDEGVRSPLKRLLYKFAKRKINGMICPNEDVGKAYGIPYCVVPDYIYTGTASNNAMAKQSDSQNQYDFCMIGRIADEKGIVEVAQKFANTKYKIIIAGKVANNELDRRLRTACNSADNITLKIGYLSEEEYNSILEKSRYAFLNYQGEYSKRSSGVVYDTLFADVPVIGRCCNALQFIEDFEMGFLYAGLSNLTEEKLDSLLTENEISTFKRNINGYRETHKEFKKSLINFTIKRSTL